jgi:hypothetical protein
MEFSEELKGGYKMEAKEVTRYSVDLGLEVGEEIYLKDITLFGEDPVSYTGIVKKKEKFLQPSRNNDIYGIYVWVEVAEKENFEEIRAILKKNQQ